MKFQHRREKPFFWAKPEEADHPSICSKVCLNLEVWVLSQKVQLGFIIFSPIIRSGIVQMQIQVVQVHNRQLKLRFRTPTQVDPLLGCSFFFSSSWGLASYCFLFLYPYLTPDRHLWYGRCPRCLSGIGSVVIGWSEKRELKQKKERKRMLSWTWYAANNRHFVIVFEHLSLMGAKQKSAMKETRKKKYC